MTKLPVQGQPPRHKLTGYGSLQFLPQNHLALLLIFGFLSSVPGDHHPHLHLPCNEHTCLNRTGHMRTAKGEHPYIAKSCSKSGDKNKLGMIHWEAKLLWNGRHGVQGDTWLLTLGEGWRQKPFPSPLLAFLAS